MDKSITSPVTRVTDSRLYHFFIESLEDIFYAEKHLVEALGTLEKKATTAELKNAFANHKLVTGDHVTRLENIFLLLNEEADTKKCEAIRGIIKEADSIADDTQRDTFTRDAALIMAAQKAEHYEIATYGSLIQLSKVLDEPDVTNLLTQTLSEEKEADETLTRLAESFINEQAVRERED